MSTTATTTPVETQDTVATLLAALLADTYSLMAQTHVAHWNVEGPAFFELHSAFQAQYEELFAAVDETAERIRMKDVYAPGGLKTLANMSRVPEVPAGKAPAKDFVAALVEGHETVLASAIALRDAAGEVNDLQNQDFAIKRAQSHEKTLWMLKSFLKNL